MRRSCRSKVGLLDFGSVAPVRHYTRVSYHRLPVFSHRPWLDTGSCPARYLHPDDHLTYLIQVMMRCHSDEMQESRH